MRRKLSLLTVAFSALICARAADAPMMMPFKIAGGLTVKCPVTDAGPLPAESGPYKVEAAGFGLGQDDGGKNTFLIFSFSVAVERKGKPTHITVEDVSDDAAVTVVDDKNPKVEKKAWRGTAAPLIVSESSTPWVFTKKATIKIFKVTVSAKDTPDVVLYQPAWYPLQVKTPIIQLAKKNG